MSRACRTDRVCALCGQGYVVGSLARFCEARHMDAEYDED